MAAQAAVTQVCVGRRYVGVRLSNGAAGVAYSFARMGTPTLPSARSAAVFLRLLASDWPPEAAVGLAVANALIPPPQADGADVLELLGAGKGTRVGMVGHFRPLEERLKAAGAQVVVFEEYPSAPGVRPAEDIPRLMPGCEVAIVTATAIANHTIDQVLEACRSCREVAVTGPSTPLLPAAFEAKGVSILAGVVVERAHKVMEVVAAGGGTRALKGLVRKVAMRLGS